MLKEIVEETVGLKNKAIKEPKTRITWEYCEEGMTKINIVGCNKRGRKNWIRKALLGKEQASEKKGRSNNT